MESKWIQIKGIITRGHQVASGMAKDSPYPQGSIMMQRPFFQERGLDISSFFLGTLNVSVFPYKFKVERPQYTFEQVKWYINAPPETFSFSPCRLRVNQQQHESLVYYPHPDTKPNHFQDDSTLEILSPFLPNIQYGDAVLLTINTQEITIFLD